MGGVADVREPGFAREHVQASPVPTGANANPPLLTVKFFVMITLDSVLL